MSEQIVDFLSVLKLQVKEFEKESHALFRAYETSHLTRITDVAESRKLLVNLSLKQEQLFDEALRCISFGLYRAAHVSAWQAFMDCIDKALERKGLSLILKFFPKWPVDKGLDVLREETNEHQRVIAAQKLGLISRSTMKSAHGHLSTRNDCAHPSQYDPGFNQTLGYVSDLITRAGRLASAK